MNKKIIFITIVLVVVILGLVGWFFASFQSIDKPSNDELSIRDFFPFGRSLETAPIPPDDTNRVMENLTSGKLPLLRKISENPISGATALNVDGENFVRFVDRATGHIWEASTEFSGLQRLTNTTIPQIQEAIWTGSRSAVLRFLRDDGETIESVFVRMVEPDDLDNVAFEFTRDLKLGDNNQDVLNLQKVLNRDSDTQISSIGVGSPQQETTYFGSKTEDAVKRFQQKYASEILIPDNAGESSGIVDELTRAKLNQLTGANKTVNTDDLESEEEGLFETILTYLPIDIKSLAYLNEPQKIFYIQEDTLGSVGTLANPDGTQRNQIFESASKEWLIIGGDSPNNIYLSQKPSHDYPGIILRLNQNGKLGNIMDGYSGLTGLVNWAGDKLAYSETQNDLSLRIADVNGTQVDPLIKTLPEKCVWSKLENSLYCAVPKLLPEGSYPDTWYQGLTSFEDIFWKIDMDLGENRPIQVSALSNSSVDATNLMLSENEQYLFFTNKKDYSLWSLKLFEIGSEEDLDIEEATTTPSIDE